MQIVTHEEGLIFDANAALRCSSSSGKVVPPLLEGDVKIIVFRATTKLFHFWFHTAYDPSFLQYGTKACNPEAITIWESSDLHAGGPTWAFALPKKELDGLHKVKDKSDANKHASLPSDFTIRLIFGKPSWEEEHEAMCGRQRERAKREAERGRRKTLNARRSTGSLGSPRRSRQRSGEDDAVDYDEMGNDTDEEEMLSTLYRGFLLRSAGLCQRHQKRWCEISTCGKLHIAGKNLLVVDVAEGDQVCRPVHGKEYAWRVRNPTNGTWEHLEVEEGSNEKQWDQAFADCMRLGDAIRDINTAFCGFFWKLNHDADEELIPEAFEFSDWRVRLFVMRVTGQVVTYSWKDKSEKLFADFSSPLCCVEKMAFSWRNMPHTVPFQILIAGEEPKVLAAKEEDFLAFEAKVNRIRAEQGIGKDEAIAEERSPMAAALEERRLREGQDGSLFITYW